MSDQARTLPHNTEAERSVLGAVLLRDKDALNEVSDKLRPEDFYVPAHQAIFRAMMVLGDKGEPIDVVTLEAQLRARDELNLVGGIEGLAKLADRYSTSFNTEAHARLVKETSQLRNFVLIAREMASKGMEDVEDVRQFLDDAEVKILEVSEQGQRAGYKSSKEVILDVFKGIQKRIQANNPITGIPSGFDQLDHMTAGLQPGDMVVLAARPSMGKTAFALNIAQNACIVQPKHANLPESERPKRYPVLFFSLEMGPEQLIERILSSEAKVDAQELRRGTISGEADFRKLVAAADRIAEAKIYIDANASPTILEIRNTARRWRNDKSVFPNGMEDTGLVVVDYLQLCRGARDRYDSRVQEISEISRGLKFLAQELRVPVIALSQLNRAVDSRTDKRPMMSDLRESGAIEQDADVIMFIFREERYLTAEATDEQRRALEGKSEVIIGKQRNGPIGTVHLTFVKRHTRFENPAPEQYQG